MMMKKGMMRGLIPSFFFLSTLSSPLITTYIPPLRMMPNPLAPLRHSTHEPPCLLEVFEFEGSLDAGERGGKVPILRD